MRFLTLSLARPTGPRPRPRPPRPFLGPGRRFLVLAAVGAACSPASDPARDGPGRVERPPLMRVQPGGGRREIERVQRHLPPEGIAPWELELQGKGRPRRLEGGGEGEPRWGLRIEARGRRRIAIPGTFTSGSFNRVALTGVFPGVFSIKLTFTGPDGAHYESGRMATITTRDVQTIVFELARRRRLDVTFDRLELLVTRGNNSFEIHGVDLLNQPPALALPDPESGGEAIVIDHARHGVGIVTGDPVSCTFEPGAGARLRFAYGIPQRLRLPDQRVRLVARVAGRGDDEPIVRHFDLESDIAVDPRWEQVEIDVGGLSGVAELRLEVTADEGEALCAVAELSVLRPSSGAPSVLLITSDTHRGDHLGAQGGVEIETPALDALASRGVLFTNCWSSTNITSPSHVALMTATHPRDTRLITNSAHLSDEAATLAESYRAAGFMTMGVVSVRHLGPAGTGLGQGFDRMEAPIGGTWDAEVSVGKVLDWLPDAEGLPVFVWLHLFDAHHPYTPPGRYDRLYYPEDKDPFDDDLPALEIDPDCIPEDLLQVRDLEFPKAQYRGEISYLDRELGKLFEHPRLAEGILAVTSDHGEVLEKDGSYFNHASLYPDTLHVPMILAWPDAPAGRRVDHGIEQIDLGRTLLDLSGLEDVAFPGRSMTVHLEGEPLEAPRFALAGHASSASVTLEPWHFVLYLRQHKGKLSRLRLEHSCELYRLDRDPECLHDLAAQEPRRVKSLRRMLVDWLTSASSTNLTTRGQQSEEALDQLAALGYATTTEEVENEAWIDPACECERCAGFR